MAVDEVTLYHTQDCHLCELAMAVLDHVGLAYSAVDIATSSDLMAAYGVRIPVIRVGERELGWPFDPNQVQAWLMS
ncbi:glutaredoxin family protein [Litorivicinus lipolyticus]|nr:glutaredoxin family protein [Litorivicinus lipolyticus]